MPLVAAAAAQTYLSFMWCTFFSPNARNHISVTSHRTGKNANHFLAALNVLCWLACVCMLLCRISSTASTASAAAADAALLQQSCDIITRDSYIASGAGSNFTHIIA